jgi:ribosome-binding factor A
MVSQARAQRIAQRIQEELADLLTREAADPRLALISVTGVEVDRELAFATVYVSALDESDRKDEVLQALRRARGFMRSALAARIDLRSFPQLRFRWDSSSARGARIEELLREIHPPGDPAGDEA